MEIDNHSETVIFC